MNSHQNSKKQQISLPLLSSYYSSKFNNPNINIGSNQKADKDCLQQQFIRKNHYQQNSNKVVIQILNCMVCLGKVTNAHMCPHCSKLSCQNCIKQWLDSKKLQCPNCRKVLKPSQLVNCSRFARQIDQTIVLLTRRQQQQELCKKHRTKLNYYCKTCEIAICSDCAMIGSDHKNHEFDKLSNVIGRQQEKVKAQLSMLHEKKRNFENNLGQIQLRIKQINNLKNEKIQEVEKFSNHLCERIEKSYQAISAKQEYYLTSLQSQWDILKTIYENINYKLNSYSKLKLINEEQLILNQIHQSRSNPTYNKYNFQNQSKNSNLSSELIQIVQSDQFSIQSQLIPSYTSKTFILKQYTSLRKKKDIYYTQIFQSHNNLQWRLKIYPNGSQSSEDNYISIFVELVNGVQQVGKYKYKVQIINQKNRNLKISRQFQSQFEIGECWGYNTYSKINILYEQGYVHPKQDFLQIILHIKSPTFYHEVLDQSKVIEIKQKKIEENKKRIFELRSILSKIQEEPHNQSFEDLNVNIQNNNNINLSEKSLIELDQICEIALPESLNEEIQQMNKKEKSQIVMPIIQDSQIFGKVIKCQNYSESGNKRKIQRFNIRSLVIKSDK